MILEKTGKNSGIPLYFEKKQGIKTIKILKIVRDASSLLNPRSLIHDIECSGSAT